jgi:hypothetical protein
MHFKNGETKCIFNYTGTHSDEIILRKSPENMYARISNIRNVIFP